jgi:hypothetical protein
LKNQNVVTTYSIITTKQILKPLLSNRKAVLRKIKMMNHKNNLNRINTMKSKLVKTKKTLFTRKDFMNSTATTSYYFNQLVQAGLIVDTGDIFGNLQGAPVAYTLPKAFSSHIAWGDKYSLNQEDISILLKAKEDKLAILKDSINAMTSQVSTIKKEKTLLKKIKLTQL